MPRLKLPVHMTRTLLNAPETGMGVQLVDITFWNGVTRKGVPVFNGEDVEVSHELIEQLGFFRSIKVTP